MMTHLKSFKELKWSNWFRPPTWSWVALMDLVSDPLTRLSITENLNCLNCIKLVDTTSFFKIVSASSCQLQPSGLKVVIYNYATISEHSQSLLNMHSYFLLAPVLFFDKYLT